MDLRASIEKLQTKLSDSEEIILRKGFEIRDLKREINKMLSKISKSEDKAIDVIEKVKKDTECEKVSRSFYPFLFSSIVSSSSSSSSQEQSFVFHTVH